MDDISSDQIEGIDDLFAQSARARRPPPIPEPETESGGEAESERRFPFLQS